MALDTRKDHVPALDVDSAWEIGRILRNRERDGELGDHPSERNPQFPGWLEEALLATVVSSSPVMHLYSERRSELSPAAHSKTRTKGVQPDYAIWRSSSHAVADCRLVIECKHYKKSGGRKFSEVLSDYALSLPEAAVYLVNYGPIGDVVKDLPEVLRKLNRQIASRGILP